MALDEILAQVLASNPKERIVFRHIFQQILNRGYARTTDTARDLNMQPRTVRKYYKKLEERGVIDKRRVRLEGGYEWRYVWGAELKYILQRGYKPIVKGG